MHMTCRYNVKVTVYSVYMCAQTGPLFPLDIIILTAQRKEANNYVTQKTISPPRLGHFLVLPLLPPLPPSVPLPRRHINVSLTGWKTAPPQTVLLFISCYSCEKQNNALISIPAVQGYSKVLVLSISPGQRREGRRGKDRRETEMEKDGGQERGGEKDKGDVGRQSVSEWKCVGEERWGGQAVKLLQQWRQCCAHHQGLGLQQ